MAEFIVTRELLKKRKCSIAEFAREVGVSGTYVRMLMDGNAEYEPSAKLIERTKKWLKCCHVCGQTLKGKDA